ncbi:MAG: hypothetical protein V4719_18075 [Planctomycetota bacterium]
MQNRLKMYLEETSVDTTPAAPGITVSLREISAILAEAVATRRHWLKDFADDPIQIPSDLYDVLVAYRRLSKRA